MNTNKITEERIIKIEDRITKLEKISSMLNNTSLNVKKPKKMSAKEFLMEKELKTEVQKTLALSYYLENMEGMESFNIEDLVNTFQLAKEKRPKNLNDAVNKNIIRGFIMEAPTKKDNKKAWVVTSTGEKFLKSTFNKNN